MLPSFEILATPVQPEAAIAFWQWRAAMPYDEVKKLSAGARERAFYVAGLTEYDKVQKVKDALGEALKNGETLADFKKRCLETIKTENWHDRHLETIFRNNMQTAYAAGRYAKMQEVKEARPFWQYFVVCDERTRRNHAILSGIVYPADHEFWYSNYPPNGHRCRCGVNTLSSRQVEKQGLKVQSKMPSASMYTDPKTGMEYFVARPGADNGWQNNPAKIWLSGLDLEKYEDLGKTSYVEQRIRPQKVKNFEELSDGIKHHAGKFLRNSDGFTKIEKNSKSYFMATNCKGLLLLSAKKFNTLKGVFQPTGNLKSAWNKLAKGEPLDWLEEYSIESLWHEITHNRQNHFKYGLNAERRRIMEIVTQWTARRTYSEFLASLGGKAKHLESIKKDGLGYGKWIRNFDKLLNTIGVNEKILLPFMHTLIDGHNTLEYTENLVDFLVKTTGKDKDIISTALKYIHWEKEEFAVLLPKLKGD